jgi:hypothetical protein
MTLIPGVLSAISPGLRRVRSGPSLGGPEKPSPGLYAEGNDMPNVMDDSHPKAGITIGPALTFGYIAARHAASIVR